MFLIDRILSRCIAERNSQEQFRHKIFAETDSGQSRLRRAQTVRAASSEERDGRRRFRLHASSRGVQSAAVERKAIQRLQ